MSTQYIYIDDTRYADVAESVAKNVVAAVNATHRKDGEYVEVNITYDFIVNNYNLRGVLDDGHRAKEAAAVKSRLIGDEGFLSAITNSINALLNKDKFKLISVSNKLDGDGSIEISFKYRELRQ